MKCKVGLSSIIFIFVVQTLLMTDAKFRYRMLQFICETSSKTIHSNVSCLFKTYKNRRSLVNLNATIIRPTTNHRLDMLATLLVQRKTRDGFQKLLEFKNIEVCVLIKNIQKAPVPFVGEILNYLKNGGAFDEGNVLDICDIFGKIYFVNGTMEKFAALEMFPSADYLVGVHLYDKFDDKIINITFISHLFK